MLAAAVLGSPIAHSLSPVLHQAAYHALGLTEWDYVRIECTAADFPGIVAGTAPETRGFSVTMPCKDAALRFADVVSTRAHLVESANTLVRHGDGWYADCTDIDGALAALEHVGHTGETSFFWELELPPDNTSLHYNSAEQDTSASPLDLKGVHNPPCIWQPNWGSTTRGYRLRTRLCCRIPVPVQILSFQPCRVMLLQDTVISSVELRVSLTLSTPRGPRLWHKLWRTMEEKWWEDARCCFTKRSHKLKCLLA